MRTFELALLLEAGLPDCPRLVQQSSIPDAIEEPTPFVRLPYSQDSPYEKVILASDVLRCTMFESLQALSNQAAWYALLLTRIRSRAAFHAPIARFTTTLS